MKFRLFVIYVFLVYVLVGNPLSAATVKKKDGQVVEGKISGVIIQKGKIEKSEKGFSVNYYPINGENIEVIDEKGVQLVQGTASVAIKLRDKEMLPTDVEVLEAAIREFPGIPEQRPIGLRIDREGELTVTSISKGIFELSTFFSQSAQSTIAITIKNGGNR